MSYVPHLTSLATRVSDGALILIPHRRNMRNQPSNCRSFTAKANERARRAAQAALRARKGQ